MAEALGIAGSIASLIELMRLLYKFQNFCTGFKETAENIRRLDTEIKAIRSVFDTSNLYAQTLEIQGLDAKEFIDVHQEMNVWFKMLENSLDKCTTEGKARRALTLGKRLKFLVQKERFEDHLAKLGRMLTIWMATKGNLESSVSQKRHAEVKALFKDLQIDFKPALLDIEKKVDRLLVGVEKSTIVRENLPLHQTAIIRSQKHEISEKGGTTYSRARLGSPANAQISNRYIFVLEDMAENPFHVLIACIFLNTQNEKSMSQAQELLQKYPTPERLADAHYREIQPFFKNLGFFRRADWLIELAKTWLVRPPQANKKFKKSRGTFESEVAHLKGVGAFANNVWRVFCKDNLYKAAGHSVTTPEWKKVLPANRGLISYLQDRWGKEGFTWDEKTGDIRERNAELCDKEIAGSDMSSGF